VTIDIILLIIYLIMQIYWPVWDELHRLNVWKSEGKFFECYVPKKLYKEHNGKLIWPVILNIH